jgi:hypothetical protein
LVNICRLTPKAAINLLIRNPILIVIDPPLELGEKDIATIALNPRSRDDTTQLVRRLQHIYTTPEQHERVFAILAELGRTGSG